MFFLTRGVRQSCVFKDGSRGSFLVQLKEKERKTTATTPTTVMNEDDLVITHIPAFRIDKVVDTTGCGDNYCAGFECGLVKGWRLVDCCR